MSQLIGGGKTTHSIIDTQSINMARTKQTARKSVPGVPTLSRNQARRLAAARAEARCTGGKEQKHRVQSPGGTDQAL